MNKEFIKKLMNLYPIQKGKENKILRSKSTEIIEINDEIIEFAEILNILMFEYPHCAGLAAPQIGKNIRMISVTKREVKGDNYKLKGSKIYMNPEIIYQSPSTNKDKEGCLSLPGMEGVVTRPNEVKLKYLDFDGKCKVIKLKGYNARIVLHEIDHLEGILFTDLAKNIKTDFDKLVK